MVLPLAVATRAETARAADRTPVHAPRPRLHEGGALRLDQVVEEQRLARLATDVLRKLVATGTPNVAVIAGYVGLAPDDILCCAEGVQRLPHTARRNLARVALAFAPAEARHTAKRLLEGELARIAAR